MAQQKETSALTMGCAAVSALGFLGCLGFFFIPQCAPTPGAPAAVAAPVSRADCPAAAQSVKDLSRLGFISKMNAPLNEALIDGEAWRTIDIDKKEAIGRALAIHCGCVKGSGLNWVDLRDRKSGKALAKYSESWGFKNYE